MRRYTYSELLAQRLTEEQATRLPRHPITVVLQNVRSLYNVGSIFRSADAFRIQKLILAGYTPSPPSAEISKTALGSVNTVPFLHAPSIHSALDELLEGGWRLCAVELATPSRQMSAITPEMYPLALILGNELTGVTEDVLDRCSLAVHIPMYGVKHSLNVAVAAGIAMYEAVRLMP